MCSSVYQMDVRGKLHTVLILVVLCSPIRYFGTNGRAIMVEPPHRSSLWRFNYSNALVNLKDDNVNCGGYDWQWRVHAGQCGVCGDGYKGSQDHADNGKYATGIIVRKYKDGHYINVTFEVSSNYLGYVEFKLCPRNSTNQILDQTCFNKYPLYIDESHGTRYYIGSRGGIYDIHIRLPGGLVCKNCVLQWKYKTGYRYNGDNTCKCLGCGRQEQYVNCADIEISPRESVLDPAHRNHRGHDVDHHGNLRRGHGENHLVIQPTATVRREATAGIPVLPIPPMLNTNVIEGTTRPTMTGPFPRPSVTTRPSPAMGIAVNFLAPSYSTISSIRVIEPTPTFATSSVDVGSAVTTMTTSSTLQQRSIASDRIKKEIIKMLGQEIPRAANANNGVKVFFTLPQQEHVGVTRRLMVAEPTRQFNFLQTQVPNTHYVSVSSILDRFYPNYITPFLFSLAKPRRQPKRRLPRGCDVTSDEFRCVARGIYKQSPGISIWCERNCRASNCVTFMCECSCEDRRQARNSSCHAIKQFKGMEGMDLWCTANCKVGYCPPSTCSVDDCMRPDALSSTSSNGEP